MKILSFAKEYQTPMYLWPRVHFIDELAHHGIEICVFNALQYESIEQANEECLKEIKTGQYDLFMTGLNEESLFIDTLAQIKAFGVPTLLICFDNLVAPYMHRNVAARYDLVWLTAPENRERFTRWGAKTIMEPYAANPYTFRYEPRPEILRAVFIGTPYGSRANLMNTFLEQEVPLTLFGGASASAGSQGGTVSRLGLGNVLHTTKEYLQYPVGRTLLRAAVMQRLNPAAELKAEHPFLERKQPVPPAEMPALYSTYGLALASTTARNTGILKHPVHIVNLRAFEIPMSGGIQLCRYNPELAGYFEPEKEILFADSDEELAEKASFYLAPEREAQRLAIRQAARKRAEGEHTWFHRFSRAFEALGLTVKNEE